MLDEASMSAEPAAVLPASRHAAGGGTARVSAPGRLHLGFLDPSGSLGRPFGSLGVVIDGFETVVEIRSAARDEWLAGTPAGAAELERAAAHVQRLREHSGRHQPLALRLHDVLPAHSGFGSGTQLALAVGRAFARWQGLEVATPTLAQWLGRGRRSGVGIAGFDAGGLLLDGGPGVRGEPAALLARIALPAAWRLIVVEDAQRQGLSGAAERDAIAQLPAFAQSQAAQVCHEVLMRVLPGAAGDDFASFAAGLNSRAGAARRTLRAGAGRQRLEQRRCRPGAVLDARGGRTGHRRRPELMGPDRVRLRAFGRRGDGADRARTGGGQDRHEPARRLRGCTQSRRGRHATLRSSTPWTAPTSFTCSPRAGR